MNPPQPVVAVVLAGGDRDDRLAATVGAASKALVPLRDVPMGAYVAHALRASGVVGTIVWVGPTDVRIRRLVDVDVPSGRRMVDSLSLGLGAALALADRDARLLIVTADLPWWEPDGVRHFVHDAPSADLVYPIVREADALARFPDQSRTYARLRDGRFTGGNAVLLRRSAVAALLPVLDAAFHARKRPWDLARLVGFGTLVGLLTGTARLDRIEERVSAILGVSARAFVSRDATIAADVDDPSHLPATLDLPALAPWVDA